jgi:hypothetical protein
LASHRASLALRVHYPRHNSNPEIFPEAAKQIQFGLHCEESRDAISARLEGDIVMKRITAIALFILASLVSAGSVSAQDNGVRATIPFDFTVGSKVLPSGTYTIQQGMTSLIVIRNREKNIAVMSTSHADSKQSKTGKLVFDKYGDQYFLREILCASVDMSVELPTSKMEKRARLQEARLESSPQVFIALNQ